MFRSPRRLAEVLLLCLTQDRVWSAARRWAERAVVSGFLSVMTFGMALAKRARFSQGLTRLRQQGCLKNLATSRQPSALARPSSCSPTLDPLPELPGSQAFVRDLSIVLTGRN